MRAIVAPITNFAAHLFHECPKLVVFVVVMCVITLYSGTYLFAQTATVNNQFDEINQEFSTKIADVENKVDTLQNDFTEFRDQQTRQFLLLEIRSMEREIYQLEQVIDSGESTLRDRQRLVQVRSDHSESLRQLNALPVN